MLTRGRLALLAWAAMSVACGAAPGPAAQARGTEASETAEPSTRQDGPARWFHSSGEQAFWVTHDEELDRIVANGTRIEADARGRVRIAAPSEATLLGSLAVAEHLGGGYVHWSNRHVFRSREFVGPLIPVTLPLRSDRSLLGARNGLAQVLVLSDAEAYALGAEDGLARPAPYPALAEMAALGPRRALRLDVFGRTQATSDAGKSWRDITPELGLSPSGIAVGEQGIWVDTPNGQFELTGDPLGAPTPIAPVRERYLPGEVRYSTIRRIVDVHPRWSRSPETLLMSAVRGGVILRDGTALGISSQVVGHIDLDTGIAVEEQSDPLHNGLSCRPFPVADGVLFACRWEQYQYYGAYVLWSEDGRRLRVERAFSDDGVFIGTDDGALAYTGSCEATPRYVEGTSFRQGDESLPNTICVRRGRGSWAERHLPDAVIDRWVPSKDGTAVALVRSRDASLSGLVPRVDAPPTMSVRGVRVVDTPTLDDEHQLMKSDGGDERSIERNFVVERDGTVSGWAVRSSRDVEVHVGVEMAPSGSVAVFETPPDVDRTVVTGRWGLARTERGQLFETRDRGRTWAAVERSPVAADAFSGSCSRLGCVLSSFVRIGWGRAKLDVRELSKQAPEPKEELQPGRVPLRCAPAGVPSVAPSVQGPYAEQASAQRGASMPTGYGDTLRLIELAKEEPEAPDSSDDPDPNAKPAPSFTTHAVVWTPPFAVVEPARALGAMLSQAGRVRNPITIPLLDEHGRVALLVMQEKDELLVRMDSVDVWPAYEEGRGYWGRLAASGGLLAKEEADVVLVLGQLPALERHGATPSALPRFFGLERNIMMGRHLSLAAAPGGERAVLALNRPQPDPVGVADIRSHGDLEAVKGLASWRAALAAGDPRCPAEDTGYRAVLVVDPAAWFSIDASAMPGIQLGHQGLLLVRWAAEGVCVEAMRLSVSSDRHGMDVAAIVARFGRGHGAAAPAAALRSEEITQPLQCVFGEERP